MDILVENIFSTPVFNAPLRVPVTELCKAVWREKKQCKTRLEPIFQDMKNKKFHVFQDT